MFLRFLTMFFILFISSADSKVVVGGGGVEILARRNIFLGDIFQFGQGGCLGILKMVQDGNLVLSKAVSDVNPPFQKNIIDTLTGNIGAVRAFLGDDCAIYFADKRDNLIFRTLLGREANACTNGKISLKIVDRVVEFRIIKNRGPDIVMASSKCS